MHRAQVWSEHVRITGMLAAWHGAQEGCAAEWGSGRDQIRLAVPCLSAAARLGTCTSRATGTTLRKG